MYTCKIITVRNEAAKVMFLQVCVCPQGGGIPACLATDVQGGAWSGGSAPGGLVSQHALRHTPPGEMATAVEGTHPTGIHSCGTDLLL